MLIEHIFNNIEDRLRTELLQLRWQFDFIGVIRHCDVASRLKGTAERVCDVYADIGREFDIPDATGQATARLREQIGELAALFERNIMPHDAHILCCIQGIEADAVTVATVAATIRQAA